MSEAVVLDSSAVIAYLLGESGSERVGIHLAAAQLRPQTRRLGLSLGDRACLALGLERGATVLTADQTWQQLSAPHRIKVIR